MKTDKELKTAIQSAIHEFEKRPLREAALGLLNTLGYRSEKRITLEPNSADQFRLEFDSAGKLSLEKALVEDWKTVDFLFQITDEEVMDSLGAQASLFRNQRVDQTLIDSYLFFAIELQQAKYTRTQLAGITREINKVFSMPVMVLFKHDECLSISIIARRMNKRDASKDVLEKVTLIKDIHLQATKRAHVEILADLSFDMLYQRQHFSNFVELQKAWEKTLDISELNKKFFREVADWYFWAVKKVRFPDDDGKNSETKRATAVIRLITRLIFVWFIKEKGLVPEELFNEQELKKVLKPADSKQSVYFKAILQNLFFATLNTEMGPLRRWRNENDKPGGRDGHYGISTVYRFRDAFNDPDGALRLFSGIPFLNGGLFECLDKRDVKPEVIIDGFSEITKNQPVVPDELFFGKEHAVDLSEEYGDERRNSERVRGLIHIFENYKFTIEENTPVEEEIALDPELLGKVFENLLAAYNPETGTTARKQTGSFYTPREIVNYMVDESLIAYLETKLNGGDETQVRLRQLMSYEQEPTAFDEAESQALIEAIDAVKVLDPACGSGAFPMGVLHKLVFILGKLDPDNSKWREVQRQKAIRETEEAYGIGNQAERQQRLIDIDEAFENNSGDYGRKLYLIENCIYGVDIQAIAVQIAKLRFFISLVVEQRVDPQKKNLGILPLPNLETKFVAANSLIGIERPVESQKPKENVPEVPPEVEEKADLVLNDFRQYLQMRNPELKDSYLQSAKKLGDEINQVMTRFPDWAPLQVEWIFTTHTKLEELRTLLPLKKPQKGTAQQLTSMEVLQLEAELKEVRSKIFRARSHETKKNYRQADKQIRTKIAELLVKQGLESDNAEKLAGWDPFDQNASAGFFDPEWMFGIMDGFDITIGNPPYVQLQSLGESADVLKRMGYETFARMGDLYCLFYEKGFQLLRPKGILAYITSNKWMRAGYGEALRKYFADHTNPLLLIDFSGQKIFESATVDVNILISEKSSNLNQTIGCSILDKGSLNNLSLFIEQHSTVNNFSISKSWSILSDIEQRIKAKIEEVGVPLKDWDIQINYGIKTGLNEAFIISGEKRKEIVAADPKSAEIIRPILRGRDIKRYRYEFCDLWLINTHNGLPNENIPRIDQNCFPAIKAHLDSFRDSLIKRSDMGDTPYNLRSCVYLDDFYKQKIIWGEISDEPKFAFDLSGSLFLSNTVFFMTGDSLPYLLGLLNSKFSRYFFSKIGTTTGMGTVRWLKYKIETLPIPKLSSQEQIPFTQLIESILDTKKDSGNTKDIENLLDNKIYSLFGFTQDEINVIEGGG
ncbi:protein containg TaqI-like C-terminal specificity domain [Longilinea arvoryzae]|uniref:site-specific DNA-methyltransferase (adenine-specific) n=1 Tax=Longilinea arvoryzae TaxID=360412 RepID=A0A0K8MY01_9CHLR|nr:TaqI-like C-terminal specificity domain-containing protein [Longilinea arvoryzae]GAP16134.1 protein containg TaqI-like C-terminal specificity domain [Longilinea arvoryzae]